MKIYKRLLIEKYEQLKIPGIDWESIPKKEKPKKLKVMKTPKRNPFWPKGSDPDYDIPDELKDQYPNQYKK
jgi:hypothetical protein